MFTFLRQDESFQQIITDYLSDFQVASKYLAPGDLEILPLIAMIAQGVDDMIPMQIRRALKAGMSEQEILEIVYHLEPVIGLPKVVHALDLIHEVIPSRVARSEPLKKEQLMKESLYEPELDKRIKDLPKDAAAFLEEQFKKHLFMNDFGHGGIALKDRERYLFVALLTLNIDYQIIIRARGSLLAGNSEEELIWAVIILLPYVGFPLVMNTVQQISKVAEELRLEKQNRD